MTIQRNLQHVAQALANLIAQFSESPRLQDLIRIYVRQIQDLEDALVDLIESIDIDTAQSSSLDALGSIVNEPRSGRNDTDYRIAIKGKIILLSSRGTREDIIALLKSVLGSVSIQVDDVPPAAFIATVLDPIDPAVIDPALVSRFVRDGSLAGVGRFVILSVAPPFQFDTGSGYDEGKYAGVF